MPMTTAVIAARNMLQAMIIIVLAFTLSVCSEGPPASWHMINVNSGTQGDANLIVIGDTTVIIDAGYIREAKANLVPYLKQLGISKIDHFFISHPHRDHYEGLAPVLDAGIKIDKLYYKIPADEVRDCCYSKSHFLKFVNYAKDHGATLIQPKTGFSLSLPNGSSLEILHAQEGNLPGTVLDVNDMSLIMKWYVNGLSVLFTGDLNHTLGEYLVADKRMEADIMKMPHHGGRSLAPNAFFDTVNPGYVLVPGPKSVWCSERGTRPREWVKTKMIPTWVNGINGNIKVEFARKNTTITPERASGDCKLKAFGTITFENSTRHP